jgi:DNA-binding MarR family transcriptional regulator
MTEELLVIIKKWVNLTFHKSISGVLKFTKENNLTISQITVLIRLHRKHNCNVSDIGENMGISNAAASQLLDRMVQLGFIERSVDSNDRRIKNLNLTQKGLKILNESFRASKEWFEELVSKLNYNEMKETITVLNRLINYVNLSNGKSVIDM